MLVSSCLCFGPIFGDQPANAEGKDLSGYCLEQESARTGKHNVTLCQTAVRIDGPLEGFSVISKAPLWDVLIFRLDRKQYAQVPYPTWVKIPSAGTSVDNPFLAKRTKRRTQINGQNVIDYYIPQAQAAGDLLFRSDDADRTKMLSTQVRCLDWPADAHPGSVIERYYCLPLLPGVPLATTRTDGRSYNTWSLRTIKTGKAESISASQFDLPANLKKVPYSESLFVSDNTKGAIEEFMGGGGK